jgi:hypothetical protein
MRSWIFVIGLASMLSACSENDPPPGANTDTRSEQPPAQTDITNTAPTQDADPKPQTGSGGEQQRSEPVQPRPDPSN